MTNVMFVMVVVDHKVLVTVMVMLMIVLEPVVDMKPSMNVMSVVVLVFQMDIVIVMVTH